jgi:hypothetical protein
MEYFPSPILQYSTTPMLRFSLIVFVRQIACEEQVDRICSAKLYAVVAAPYQLVIRPSLTNGGSYEQER